MYLQTQGVAIGKPCVPPCANFYLGWWEQQLLGDKLYLFMWHRYIDNVFILWDVKRELLEEYVTRLGEKLFNLALMMACSQEFITFLDVKIYVTENGKLISDLYRKETAHNSILHHESFHPRPLLNSIQVVQYLQLKRTCAEKSEDIIKNVLLQLIIEQPISLGIICYITQNLDNRQTSLDSSHDSRDSVRIFEVSSKITGIYSSLTHVLRSL